MKMGVAALALVSFFATNAMAAEFTVTQSGKKFSVKEIEVAVGDTILFVNDDATTHNIHSTADGHQFDLGAQKPGTELAHTFTAPGKIKIRCAIHPKMKLTVIVN